MINVRTLGGGGLTRADGVEVRSVLAQPKRFALLIYLALAAPGQFHRRDALLALLWPESDTDRARSALRTSLHFLRRSLGEAIIESRGADEVGLAPKYIRCDAVAFQRELDGRRYAAALELYQGALLPGFAVDDAPAWNEWLDRERLRLARRAADAAWALADRSAETQDLQTAAAWGRRAQEYLPDDEVSVRRLMDLLARGGDRPGALQAFAEFQRRMESDWGVGPSAATERVAATIQSAASVVSGAAPSAPTESATAAAGFGGLGSTLVAPPEAGYALPAAVSPLDAPAPHGHAPAASRKRRRVLRAGALGAGVLIVAAGVRFMIPDDSRPGAPLAGTERIVVLPFAIRSDSPLEYLGEGMVELLGAKFDGAGELRSADPRAILAAAPGGGTPLGPPQGEAVAARLQARFYVLGGLVANGDNLQLTASLYDRNDPSTPPVMGEVDGSADDLFSLVDALATDLLTRRASTPAERLERIAARTTHSLPALKLYLQGTRALRRGEFDRAVELLQGAVAEDSTFALASYQLANAMDEASRSWPLENPLMRALRHADRLSEHDRLLIEARAAYYDVPDGPGKSELLFRRLLARHPTDVDAWYHLGDIVFHLSPSRGWPFSTARAPMLRALALDPNHLSALQHLARIEAWEGRLEALDSLTRQGVRIATHGDQLLELLALRTLALDDGAARQRLIELLEQTGDLRAQITISRALIYSRQLGRAEPLIEPLLDPARPPAVRAHAHTMRAEIALARGQPRAALRALTMAERIDPRSTQKQHLTLLTFPLATGYCGTGAQWPGPSAESAAASLGRGSPAVCSQSIGHALAATARLDSAHAVTTDNRIHQAWAGGAMPIDSALKLLPTWTHPSFPRGYFRLIRADLLLRKHQQLEALRWLSSVGEDLDDGGLIYYAPAELRQAQILEALGHAAAAATHYARFIELWRDAEPELWPLVTQAGEHLLRLGGNGDS